MPLIWKASEAHEQQEQGDHTARDKPDKNSKMFYSSQTLLISKTDRLPC
jgi:hypothetical protein